MGYLVMFNFSFYAGEHNYSIPFVVVLCLIAAMICGGVAYGVDYRNMNIAHADAPHRWFAWHPVRLQGGQPIPTVQAGGKVVWLKTIERFRFFDHWVYREIGDQRQLTQ